MLNHNLYFIGGIEQLNYYMGKKIQRIDFFDKPKSESIIFEVTLESDGTITQINQLINNPNLSDFDKKIIKLLKNSNGNWIPKKEDGKYVSAIFKLYAAMEVARLDESIFYKRRLSFKIVKE